MKNLKAIFGTVVFLRIGKPALISIDSNRIVRTSDVEDAYILDGVMYIETLNSIYKVNG